MNFLIKGKNLSNASPSKTNGVPNPRENRSSKGIASANEDLEPTQKRIAANTGPIHGVQAKPKVVPNKKAPVLVPETPLNLAWYVLFKNGIDINFANCKPITINSIPVTLLSIGR